MPTYRIKAPDGSAYDVTAPDGASEQDILAYAQKQWKPKEEYKPIKATDSMSGPDKFLAGVGKSFVDIGRGASQMVGMGDQKEIDEARKRDAELTGTGAGLAGNITGSIATVAPAMVIPGINTIAGASLLGGGMNALQPTSGNESRVKNIAVGAALGGGAQYGLGKLGEFAGKRLAAAETKGAELTAQNATRDASLQAARAEGLAVPPATANPSMLNRMLEGYAGKISTAQGASVKNAPKLDALIKGDVRGAGTVNALEKVRAEAGKAYEAVKKTGKIVADDAYAAEISALGGAEYAAVVKDMPELANAGIGTLSKALNKPEIEASTAVSLMKKLRHDATANYKNRMDPDKLALAKAQESAAEALEGLVERNLTARGMPDAMQQFREARTLIAKAHAAENALNESTGSFAASDFAKAFDKGKHLSDGMRKVGEFANAFPKAAQEVKSSMPGVSPLDYAAVGGISAATGIPSILAGILGRPLVRSAILSQPYQKAMAGPQNYGPGLLTQKAPGVLEELERLGLGGLLGSVYPSQ